jgi:hypothetical protein
MRKTKTTIIKEIKYLNKLKDILHSWIERLKTFKITVLPILIDGVNEILHKI